MMEVSGQGGSQSTYAAGRFDPRFPPLGWAGGRQLYSRQHPPKNFCLARRCLVATPLDCQDCHIATITMLVRGTMYHRHFNRVHSDS